MAGARNGALPGPRAYDGERRDYPDVHPEGRTDAGPDDIDAGTRALGRVWAVVLAGVLTATVVAAAF